MASSSDLSKSRAFALQIVGKTSPIRVLGPFERAVIWVQGCTLGCPGCLVPESWPATAGESVSVSGLADWIIAQPDIEGITLSGGEPMQQACGLVSLIDVVRGRRDLGVVCYTGYRMDDLQTGNAAHRALLTKIDLLIDGPYRRDLHASLLWRGSKNQRLLPLTDRYRGLIPPEGSQADTFAGMQFFLQQDNSLGYAGVPPVPEFYKTFTQTLSKYEINTMSARKGANE